YPDLVQGTAIDLINPENDPAPCAPPSIVLQHAAVDNSSDYSFLRPQYLQRQQGNSTWHLTAETKMKLSTGRASVMQRRFYQISASATEQRLVGTIAPSNSPDF